MVCRATALGRAFLIDVSPPCRSSSRWLRTLRHIPAEIHHSPLATLVRGFNVCDDMFTAEGMILDQTLAFPQSPQNTPPESISPPQYEHFVSPVENRTPTTSSFSYLLPSPTARSTTIRMRLDRVASP